MLETLQLLVWAFILTLQSEYTMMFSQPDFAPILPFILLYEADFPPILRLILLYEADSAAILPLILI